jgi:hypothetical protein
MSALAPKADISRFMSTRPNWDRGGGVGRALLARLKNIRDKN